MFTPNPAPRLAWLSIHTYCPSTLANAVSPSQLSMKWNLARRCSSRCGGRSDRTNRAGSLEVAQWPPRKCFSSPQCVVGTCDPSANVQPDACSDENSDACTSRHSCAGLRVAGAPSTSSASCRKLSAVVYWMLPVTLATPSSTSLPVGLWSIGVSSSADWAWSASSRLVLSSLLTCIASTSKALCPLIPTAWMPPAEKSLGTCKSPSTSAVRGIRDATQESSQ
mmetsp:Transcript_7981/g.25016  ORF Transcript_7981/g.25016 Transcript_7981/m.25016 type:complete len:223 (+) Transcript_7981:280-948(+)